MLVSNKGIKCYFALLSVGNAGVMAFQQEIKSPSTKGFLPSVCMALCRTTCFSHKEEKNAGIRDSNYMFLQTELTRKWQIASGSI